ncbi:hypothetical protein BH09SUM1_BH09SUM1_21150 [soil metagenome]
MRAEGRRTKVYFAIAALALAVGAGAAEPAVNSGLRLGDLFDSGDGAPAEAPAGARWDPKGPALIIPNTAMWRIPKKEVTPTPTPVLLGIDIPRLPMKIETQPNLGVMMERPAFSYHGIMRQPPGRGLSLIRMSTAGTKLRVRYQLLPGREGDGDTSAPITFLHAPKTAEEFAIPAGEYRLELRAWRVENPQEILLRKFLPQTMTENGIYEFELSANTEEQILKGFKPK